MLRPTTLSGRFAVVTVLFVVLAELLILLPAVAFFRTTELSNRLERAQIAGLALLATDSTIAPALERELLANAEVYNVLLVRDDIRQLVLSSPIPEPIHATYDLREMTLARSLRDTLALLADREDRVIRVIGAPVKGAGALIEVTTGTEALRRATVAFGVQVGTISAAFAILTALLLNLAASRLILVPIRRVIDHMSAWAAAPTDARTRINPDAATVELREAEAALAAMQDTVTASIRQRERLALLGQAVAKISHDLRNILTTGQMFADRLEASDDPAVRRAAPKLVASIARAVSLCETTLAYGRAEEPAPVLAPVALGPLAAEVIEGEALAAEDRGLVTLAAEVPEDLVLHADRDQLHRLLANLVRNARQAIEAAGRPGQVTLAARRQADTVAIRVADTGPGLPERARAHLFQPFSGGTRKGGTGLGLAISDELARGHGGRLALERSGPDGTVFVLHLPAQPDAGMRLHPPAARPTSAATADP